YPVQDDHMHYVYNDVKHGRLQKLLMQRCLYINIGIKDLVGNGRYFTDSHSANYHFSNCYRANLTNDFSCIDLSMPSSTFLIIYRVERLDYNKVHLIKSIF